MSIDQTNVIDFLGSKPGSGTFEMFISDHLPWDADVLHQHLELLQKKINSYLAAIESGEVLRKNSQYAGKKAVISVIGKYSVKDKIVKEFYSKAREQIQQAGFDLKFELADAE